MTAQWDDDVHHALHWLLTGETVGYYADFACCEAAAHTLEHGFHHDGRWSSFRGRTHGRAIDWSATDPWRLVVALQTHDQVGNRSHGERLSAMLPPDLLACGAALLLSLPYTPMLFMGEEWGASTPWRFFTSFPGEELGDAVTEGRRKEFETHGWTATDLPDPQAPETYWISKLDWRELEQPAPTQLYAWYRSLIGLRRTEPDFGSGQAADGATTAAALRCSWEERTDGRAGWFMVGRGRWRTVANLSDHGYEIPLASEGAEIRLAWGDRVSLDPDRPQLLRLPGHSVAVVQLSP